MSKKKTGRPAGAPNKAYDVVDRVETRCRCGSTSRAEYSKVDRVRLSYVHLDPKTGHPYNTIEYRPTKCLVCGQVRKDRTNVLR